MGSTAATWRQTPHAEPQASIVIPHHNGPNLLEACLSALGPELDRSPRGEVIVVDNASTDGSCAWLRKAWPDVRLIELRENRGFAAACNVGATSARAPFVIFLNNDAVVQPGWAKALLRGFAVAPEVVVVGGLALFQDRPNIVNSAGVSIALSAAGTDRAFGERRDCCAGAEGYVAGVSGVSMAVRRDWFLQTGGFDEGFFMYFEDVDLCLRAWLEGYKVRFIADSVVLHAFGATSGSRYTRLRSYYGSRNRLLTAYKTFDLGSLALAIALSLIQDLMVIAWLVASRRFRYAAAATIGKALGTLAAFGSFPGYWSRRQVARARHRRSVRRLRELGVLTPLGTSVREFVRLRAISGEEYQRGIQ
jgi:GT2 family glycosyltransferase